MIVVFKVSFKLEISNFKLAISSASFFSLSSFNITNKSIKSVKSPYVYYSLQRFTYKIIDIKKLTYTKLIGFLILWILFWLYKFYSGREGLGRGDIKLTSALGAWVGISNIMDVLLVASVLGLLVSGLMIFLNKHSYNKTIAFGPFLILGGHFVIIKEFLL